MATEFGPGGVDWGGTISRPGKGLDSSNTGTHACSHVQSSRVQFPELDMASHTLNLVSRV